MKKLRIIVSAILLMVSFASLAIYKPVSAGQCGDVETSILDCGEETEPGDIILNRLLTVIDIMSIGVGILGVIGISIFGIQYLTAKGNAEQAIKARRRLFQVIIGLIVYALAFGLLQWLLPNFNPADPEITSPSGTDSSSGSDSDSSSSKSKSSSSKSKSTSSKSSSSSNNPNSSANKVSKICEKIGFNVKDKKVYYCDKDHRMLFGEQKIGGYEYYFNTKTGVMKTNGFQKIGNKTYYYDKNGHKLYGPQTINGKSYYFDPETGAKYEGELYFGVPLSNYHSISKLTPSMLVNRAKEIMQYAHAHRKDGFDYGNSQAYPPGTDNKIACERLISITLYSYGFRSQPNGGYSLATGFLSWLPRLGFKESHSLSSIKRGSIVWLKYEAGQELGHVFIVDSWDRHTNVFSRYDAGRYWKSKQPIVTKGFPYNIVPGNLKVFNLP